MKTYFVKTQSSNNEMLLHSTMQKEFATTSLQEAEAMFNKEVAALAEDYDTYEQLGVDRISDHEQANAIYCSIIAIDDMGDDEVEFIQDSEYFYER